MNTKFNKIVKTAAMGIFFMALLMNVKVSLTDPFVSISNDALAQSSSSSSSNPPSCEAQYTEDFKLTDLSKWCGSYFTFWQDCEYVQGAMCPCTYVEEEDCV
ncbi:hypothetical protein [uncultured Algoriphagus sp.]|uniref:hypothetical protein n=1 Tax=uncultured Algoriphagus sp. TaxID=417365 RepID=UPI0030EBA8F3|tara:strand:+ start:834 stop:1139 length:306 start_codon:yes stop_codon:yes gene_type:complete